VATAGLILVVVGSAGTELTAGLVRIRLDRCWPLLVYGVNLVRQSRDYDRGGLSVTPLPGIAPAHVVGFNRVANCAARLSVFFLAKFLLLTSKPRRPRAGTKLPPTDGTTIGEGGCGARATDATNSARTDERYSNDGGYQPNTQSGGEFSPKRQVLPLST